MLRKIISLLLAIVLCAAVCGCAQEQPAQTTVPTTTPTQPTTEPTQTTTDTQPAAGITLNAFNGAEVDILHQTVRAYIDGRNNPETLAQMLKEELAKSQALIKQTVALKWQAVDVQAPYTVSVADNEAFENAFTVQTSDTACYDVGIFVPGMTYYWKVAGADGTESTVDSFTVKDAPARLISAGSMFNVRDMGGWSVATGEKIAYGMIYRGDDPRRNGNALTSQVFEYLGINGQVDLRYDSSDTASYFGEDKAFLNAGILYFYQVVPGEYDYKKETTDNIGKIFKFLADEENYPVYLHCSWGKDRTGTICYLIGGLLGMSYEDLMCDYELSSYGQNIESQPRNEIISDGAGGWTFRDAKDDPWGAVGRLHYVISQKYPADTTSQSIAKYLMGECGVTADEIAQVKEILLTE